MKKIDPIVLGIIALVFLVIGGVMVAAMKQQGVPIPQYDSNNQSRPFLEISEIEFDLGRMRLDETKAKDVVITNSGTKPLILSDIFTSCNCTFAHFIIGGRESPRFSMHRNPQWRGELPPSSEAVVKVTYQPIVMPVQGRVSREVVFRTNDPEKPLVNLKFTAIVD